MTPEEYEQFQKTLTEDRIKEIEKDRRGYEIKLSNNLELSFDKKFNLVDIEK